MPEFPPSFARVLPEIRPKFTRILTSALLLLFFFGGGGTVLPFPRLLRLWLHTSILHDILRSLAMKTNEQDNSKRIWNRVYKRNIKLTYELVLIDHRPLVFARFKKAVTSSISCRNRFNLSPIYSNHLHLTMKITWGDSLVSFKVYWFPQYIFWHFFWKRYISEVHWTNIQRKISVKLWTNAS